MKTRIVKVLNWDINRNEYPHRFSCQRECRFLFWKYWEEFNWYYGLGESKKSVHRFILENTKAPKGVVEVIIYPEDQE